MRIAGLCLVLVCSTWLASAANAETLEKDVCVYTATPSGIMAAIAVKKAGKSVVIVEPSRWVGGMLGAGLKPMQDCPNYNATGGMTRPLLKSLGQPEEGSPRLATRDLSPLEIRQDFLDLLEEHAIPVVYDHRAGSCTNTWDDQQPSQIKEASFHLAPFDDLGCPVAEPQTKDHLIVKAKIFIDASYEGDLLRLSSAQYRTGRESQSAYNEQAAGVRPPVQLTPIDPYNTPGDPNSLLLPHIDRDHHKPIGSADKYTQAYNYRYYTTNNPEHRTPIERPANYNPLTYELMGRYVEYLSEKHTDPKQLRKALIGICPGWMNSAEWNYQRDSLISMAPLGISQIYADGNDATHAQIWKLHQEYLRGLFEFMRTDPRVPEWYRDEIAQLGLDKRHHPETGGWPHQLYIRVARRLEGRYVITEHDVYNRTQIDDPIGLAQYGIDTYPSRRIVVKKDGQTFVANEGNMFVGGNKGPTNVPYPIPYRAITPIKKQCTNLLVPVCFSATHLGYASARMEPVFMICGESAGIAAVQSIDENCAVQDIDMPTYLASLEAAGQKLRWDPAVDQSTSSSSQQLDFARLLKECDTDENGTVSQAEWNGGKKGWEFLFAFIDQDNSGQISPQEYSAFQQYKKEHADWQKKIQAN
ncbi:FAD-dependent oxidoreductase [Bremerella cremea]|uniref:FAD-dependent oxidoreductase n=1 Tax=Bremerella cremea TaxID=1031537 RepID=UPI0031E854CF